MKKSFIALYGPLMLAALFTLLVQTSTAQIVNEQTRKKFSIGIGMFTDIWNNLPKDPATGKNFETRNINQGFQSMVMYNIPFGKSDFGFSVGLGFRTENLYIKDAYFKSTKDSTYMVKLHDSINVKRSKLVLPYIELPLELYFKSKSKVAVALGFKLAYGLPVHTKYVGENFNNYDPVKYRAKLREIQNVEKFSYGPTLRIGYRWFHVFGYYSLSKVFSKEKGPDMYPISVGLLLLPY